MHAGQRINDEQVGSVRECFIQKPLWIVVESDRLVPQVAQTRGMCGGIKTQSSES